MEDELALLGQEISICQKCPLGKTRTKAVPGEGNPKAKILFVGEGPGGNEDKQGRPFVGEAGRFLEELLKSIGLEREDVFITNLVKCRPPGNRDPKDEEIDICTKLYLTQQIKLINPKIIVCLGRYAAKYFLPDKVASSATRRSIPTGTRTNSPSGGSRAEAGTITSLHGRAFKKDDRAIFVAFHPAVALYRGGAKNELFEDFKKLKKLKGVYA